MSNNKYSGTVLYVTKELLQAWTREKVIDDVCNLEGQLLNKEYEELET